MFLVLTDNNFDVLNDGHNRFGTETGPWYFDSEIPDAPIDQVQGQLELVEQIGPQHDVLELDVTAPNGDTQVLPVQVLYVLAEGLVKHALQYTLKHILFFLSQQSNSTILL